MAMRSVGRKRLWQVASDIWDESVDAEGRVVKREVVNALHARLVGDPTLLDAARVAQLTVDALEEARKPRLPKDRDQLSLFDPVAFLAQGDGTSRRMDVAEIADFSRWAAVQTTEFDESVQAYHRKLAYYADRMSKWIQGPGGDRTLGDLERRLRE